MRIAMIGQKRTGSREGGVEVVVTELATRMAALGHEVTCYDRSGTDVNGGPTPTDPYGYRGVRVVPVPTINRKGLAALTSSFAATRRALRDGADVIHYHAEGPCVPLAWASRADARTVATIHGLDWRRAKWGGLARRYIKLGESVAARCADELIVLSRGMRGYFREEYGREARLIPNGVDTPRSVPAQLIAERWGLAQGSYVLFLGRIVPEKRPELLLEAFRGLETGKRLVIAGGASDTLGFYGEVRALAERDPRVIMAGFVEGEALAELYSNAYCYVLPSDVEGMPMSLLEAMSYGCCCITSDLPECADVTGPAGMVFPRGDAVALRQSLAHVIADPARAAALGAAARRRVENEYDWDSVVCRTLEVYAEGI